MNRLRRLLALAAITAVLSLITLAALWYLAPRGQRRLQPGNRRYTVAQRVEQFGPAVRNRVLPAFAKAGIPYPPAQMTLVGIKDRKVLEVFARSGQSDSWKKIMEYPVLGASGRLGPKLREGDRQVPEGIYRIESLNPNSAFHLALRVSYPNEFDREKGEHDGRKQLGGDIMIHGNTASIGCLAMGDEAAEDLFVMVAECGYDNVKVILTPVDFRIVQYSPTPDDPSWTHELYREIKNALKAYPI